MSETKRALIALLRFINEQVEVEEELGVWIEENEDDLGVKELNKLFEEAYE